MMDKKQIDIRRAKKESLYFKEISNFFMKILLDDKKLNGVFINRVQLSPSKTVCNVLFYCNGGEEEFKKILPHLILYKPSVRKSLSQNISSRYTPEVVFRYDKQFEKQLKLESIFNKLDLEE